MITFEAFQTVPVVALRDMDPYMSIQEDNPPFPIPGEEYHFIRLDLSRALIKNPGHTFFIQLTEDTMVEAGLLPGDILIVDRSMEPRAHSMIIAFLEGEFILRRLEFSEEGLRLRADHPEIPPVEIEPDTEFGIWGVVRDVIHGEERQ
jgi:DNA polymerase V